MSTPSQTIQLSWLDPSTQAQRQPVLTFPIAFGRRLEQMPSAIRGRQVSRMVLLHPRVSRYHALIDWEQGQAILRDQDTSNGTFVNDLPQRRCILQVGDRIQIGPVTIYIQQISPGQQASEPQVAAQEPVAGNTSPTSYNVTPISSAPTPSPDSAGTAPAPTPQPGFPPASFRDKKVVSVQSIEQSGYFQKGQDEVTYAALGAGLGSYIWVDYLRIYGVKPYEILAIGTQAKPYAKYKQLCLNSQIPLHERLRSNSDSCPDNIWGWPSYALRESWHEAQQGQLAKSFRYLWQVFAEPTLAETYTPRADNVFDSIDREAQRIGWPNIYRYGSIRCIRKTDDGRYAIAYSKGGGQYGYILAKYVHLATGYPGIRFLKHLQDYRDQHQDIQSVVNAYEHHDHVYEHLAKQGGRVIVQGRGIVASRILQRLDEVRTTSRQELEVVHLMRSPKRSNEGNRFGWAQRTVRNHWEFQPFNWPKACWGGDLRDQLEAADPATRKTLMKSWGGTTTADRRDWQTLVDKGLSEKWYRLEFGSVQSVKSHHGQLQVTYGETGESSGLQQQSADFIIDATGLSAAVTENPLLRDLIERYQLPLIDDKSFAVSNEFEMGAMTAEDQQNTNQNSYRAPGRMYAAGVTTLGGPYAAVDSFLGLQYAALRTVEHLAQIKAKGLKRLSIIRSFSQWLRWVKNQEP